MILGTGWASFRVLADIDTKKTDVTVVSPRNHLLFTPMLASSALGTVNQRSICQPVRPLVAKKNATYYESAVVAIDKENKKVTCRTVAGQDFMLPYDKLVVGVGFQPNDFNIPGVKEHALFMKETADATRFKDHAAQTSQNLLLGDPAMKFMKYYAVSGENRSERGFCNRSLSCLRSWRGWRKRPTPMHWTTISGSVMRNEHGYKIF